jgi:hypothetical protein
MDLIISYRMMMDRSIGLRDYLEREFINEFKEGQKLKAIAKESTIQKKRELQQPRRSLRNIKKKRCDCKLNWRKWKSNMM